MPVWWVKRFRKFVEQLWEGISRSRWLVTIGRMLAFLPIPSNERENEDDILACVFGQREIARPHGFSEVSACRVPVQTMPVACVSTVCGILMLSSSPRSLGRGGPQNLSAHTPVLSRIFTQSIQCATTTRARFYELSRRPAAR